MQRLQNLIIQLCSMQRLQNLNIQPCSDCHYQIDITKNPPVLASDPSRKEGMPDSQWYLLIPKSDHLSGNTSLYGLNIKLL